MVKSWNGFPGIYNINFGDGDGLKEIRGSRLAMAINKLSKLKFLWNGQDPQARLRIRRTCVFPLAT